MDQDLATVQGGVAYVTDIERRLAPYFARTEPRERAMAYLRGLLSEAERKNSWQLAEVSGAATPYGFQHLLGRADWEADAVRDELHRYIVPQLGDPAGVLVVDETGFLKKGRHSAGVARQYSGTAGRIENCQIGVFLGYAGRLGHALLDRELYLPQEWLNDRERCRRAGIPEARRFATKPQLARQMLERARAAGVPAKWVTGDSVYGDDRRLRMWLEARPQAYVLAVSGKEYVWLGWQQRQVKTILAALPAEGWTRLSAGDGAKGPRWYDWCWLPLADPGDPYWRRWLVVRRSVSDPKELRASVVFAPQDTTLAEVVRVAGTRWTIESCLEAAKGEVGLDHYEVRSWTGWYRHITLAMWALALLTVLRVGAIAVETLKKNLLLSQEQRSLATFKARRGLPSR
ncbi:MAG TPA: IS701 family transposase [Alphaproteobacteria bacterium]|nr:IS701 family transposase [Alphaproteobacteria bacterium]